MNCPRCHQLVGADQFAWSPLRDVYDPCTGSLDGSERDLYIACDCCGAWHLVIDAGVWVRERHGPFDFSSAEGVRVLRRLGAHCGRRLRRCSQVLVPTEEPA